MIRVGIIGCGNIARTHARAYEQIANAQVVATADIRPEAAEAMAARFGARAYAHMDGLLADRAVDMADICLPTYVHEEATLAAARAGKHVLCEKPLTLSLASADRMVAAVREAGVTAMVAQVIRFWPHYLAIKRMLDTGALGAPLSVYAARLGRLPAWGTWFHDPQLSGGALLDLHVHDLDWLYYLFGRPTSVYALGVQSANGAWDHVSTALDFGSVRAVVEASFRMPDSFPFTMYFRLLGERGMAEYQFGGGQSDPAGKARLHRLVHYPHGQPAHEPACKEEDPYLAEIRYFVDCLDECRAPAVASLDEARDVLAIALAAKRSLESGEATKL